MREVSEGGPGSPGRTAQLKRAKDKVVWVFLFEQIRQVSMCKLVFKTRDLRMEKTNDLSPTLSALPPKVS